MTIQRSSLLCAILFAASCVAQTAPTFAFLNSLSGPSPLDLSAIDLNNDGITDIVGTGDTLPAEFDVSIARGNGTFLAPVRYLVAGATSVPMRFVSGDFNGDGKVDLVFTLPGMTLLAVAMGNGDGTFQAVKYVQVQLAPGETFSTGLPIWAADFNHDKKLDLVVGAVSPPYNNGSFEAGPQDVYVLEGDGDGEFTNARSVSALPANRQIDSIAIGHFDSDNNADVVVSSTPIPNPFAPGGLWDLHVFFGTGNFDFEDHLLVSLGAWTNIPTLSTGDVNGDGRSDIFFINGGTDQLDVYLGQTGKAFTVRSSNMPSLVELRYDSLIPREFVMADFNDDGRMDLVAYAFDVDPQSSNLVFMLGSDPPGTFAYRVVPLPADYSQNNHAVVGVFNRDAKPDVLVGLPQSDFGGSSSTLLSGINSTSGGVWSNCAYPMGRISLCSPIQYSPGEVSFNASADSSGLLRKMELWVDGKKVSEQHHAWENRAWLNFTSSFDPGPHHASLFSADIDNSLHQLDFSFIVGPNGCDPPASPGVNICKPWAGSLVGSPITVQATARITGTLARMEIWVDGVKKFTEKTSTWFEANLELRPGKHRVTVFAVNTTNTKWMQNIDVTVEKTVAAHQRRALVLSAQKSLAPIAFADAGLQAANSRVAFCRRSWLRPGAVLWLG